ncbi:hypothetical protein AVDCRST_MAG84-2357 [uncultured Microcoleus sp.]|uniref:Uncharacterized protein n=1 Tax=uncultured Microcoleus sp. TaxID=259945 RepID=A0A6J4LVC1_9CYAN|nr:hypothetical protein AVDCRST_MAG84-2357 [uncultured Microcoleus sp.]
MLSRLLVVLSNGESQYICRSVLSYYHNESLQIIKRQAQNYGTMSEYRVLNKA